MKPAVYLVVHIALFVIAAGVAVWIFYDLINHYTLIKDCEAPVNYFHCEYRLESSAIL
jgi:hypothetical protein